MFSTKFVFWFLVTLCFSFHLTLENSKVKAAVGARINGDKLILKDSLNSPVTKKPLDHTINFEYPIINKVISYIELRTNSNAAIQFTLNEQNKGELLIGSATAISSKDFHLDVVIFGFNATDKPEKFQAILRPELGYSGEIPQTLDYNLHEDDDFDDYIHEHDGYLEIGEKQSGDYLLYEKEDHINTDLRQKQTLTFYYVDSDYVTYAKIITLKTTTASAIYFQVTEHSLKVVIEDENVHALSAIFQVYGYRPEDKPIDYFPMIGNTSKLKSNNPLITCSGNYIFRLYNFYFFTILTIILTGRSIFL